MRKIPLYVLIVFLAVMFLWAQSPVKITDGAAVERILGAAGAAYNSGMTTLPNSSTAVTGVTTYAQFIHCANIDSVARTLTITDNQGTPKVYFNAVSLPANSVLTAHYGPVGLPFASGIKWSASATSAINCIVVGVQ